MVTQEEIYLAIAITAAAVTTFLPTATTTAIAAITSSAIITIIIAIVGAIIFLAIAREVTTSSQAAATTAITSLFLPNFSSTSSMYYNRPIKSCNQSIKIALSARKRSKKIRVTISLRLKNSPNMMTR